MFCSAHAFKIPLATNTRIIYISRIYNFYRQIPGWWISLLKQGCIHSAEVYQSLPMFCIPQKKKKQAEKSPSKKKGQFDLYSSISHLATKDHNSYSKPLWYVLLCSSVYARAKFHLFTACYLFDKCIDSLNFFCISKSCKQVFPILNG